MNLSISDSRKILESNVRNEVNDGRILSAPRITNGSNDLLQPFSLVDHSLHSNQTNGHNHSRSSTPISLLQCATSLSNFPRFPPPANFENKMSLGLPSSRIQRTNPVSRRTRHFVPNDCKDEYYWQKRRKNNEAARKSREKRRTIDSVLEEKVLILSHQNKLLRDELHTLKLKYGEISKDANHETVEGTSVDKMNLNQLKEDNLLYRYDLAYGKPLDSTHQLSSSDLRSSSNDIRFPTAISLPKLNVILENDQSGDLTSSAKLVLSNLTSGTLILSPISLPHDTKPIKESIENCSKVAPVSIPSVRPGSVDNFKAVEAAHALANLFRGDGINRDSDERKSQELPERENITPKNESKSKDTKSCLNLPHKLRFKNSRQSLSEA